MHIHMAQGSSHLSLKPGPYKTGSRHWGGRRNTFCSRLTRKSSLKRTKMTHRPYLVCNTCNRRWIWQDRLVRDHTITCRQCGSAWQKQGLPDLKATRRQTQWAKWNFSHAGQTWPHRTYKQALLEPPQDLQEDTGPKRTRRSSSVLYRRLCRSIGTLPRHSGLSVRPPDCRHPHHQHLQICRH